MYVFCSQFNSIQVESSMLCANELLGLVLHRSLQRLGRLIIVTEKGLLLDKANFLEKGYKIDEQKFPCNPNKIVSSSGKEKKKVEFINLSDDKREDLIMDEDDAVQMEGDVFEEQEELEEDEAGNRIPLEGCRFGGARIGEEYNADFPKVRFEVLLKCYLHQKERQVSWLLCHQRC